MKLFIKKDPLPKFQSGKINEYQFLKALNRLKDYDVKDFDLNNWKSFIIDKNQISFGHNNIYKYLKVMVSLIKDDEILSDIVINGIGDDAILADALRLISSQEALQKVLETFNIKSPFHRYKEYKGRYVHDKLSFTTQTRGGRIMYVLIKLIDLEHFNKALINTSYKLSWLEDIKNERVKYWSFYDDGNFNIKYDEIYNLAKEKGFIE